MLVLTVTLVDDNELEVLRFTDTTESSSSPYASTTFISRHEFSRNYIYSNADTSERVLLMDMSGI